MSYLTVSVDNGKYTVIQNDDGSLKALRYGKEWQDLTGNNLVLALAQALEAERGITKNYQIQVKQLFDRIDRLENPPRNSSGYGDVL